MSRYELVVVGVGLGLAVLQILLCRSLVGACRRVHALDERVTRLGDALSLLTETAESGFRSMACEVERLSTRPRRASSRPATTARVGKAARRGRTVQDIAAAAEVSESEVHLRLRLAEQDGGPPAAATPAPAQPAAAPRRAERGAGGGSIRTLSDWLRDGDPTGVPEPQPEAASGAPDEGQAPAPSGTRAFAAGRPTHAFLRS
jgi:hypothetical protein